MEIQGTGLLFPFKIIPLEDDTEFLHIVYWLVLGHLAPYNCNWVQDVGVLLENGKEKATISFSNLKFYSAYGSILKTLPK